MTEPASHTVRVAVVDSARRRSRRLTIKSRACSGSRWLVDEPLAGHAADRVSEPLEVSVHVPTDAPVALVDHPRAERPGLDQLQRDVLGDRREERRAATDDDRMAEHAQLID